MLLSSVRIAIKDIVAASTRYPLIAMLGWQDVRQRYRRSILGPFWLTISMGVMIATLGLVFGQIFKSPMEEFLPFLTAGLVHWGFITATLINGCSGFISAEGIIKQLPIPLFVHIMRLVWQNLIILAHNIVIFPLVLIAVGRPLGMVVFLYIPGLLLLIINLTWMILFLAVVCARFRDLPRMVESILQVVYFLTPIVWLPKLLPERATIYLLDSNPAFHLLEIVRSPLLGQFPTAMNWIVSSVLAFCGWIVALILYGRYKRRIAYWL
jgi:lipopolysaccharide transport system permease protein